MFLSAYCMELLEYDNNTPDAAEKLNYLERYREQRLRTDTEHHQPLANWYAHSCTPYGSS